MSLVPHSCPGCLYGGSHLEDCPNRNHPTAVYNEAMKDDHMSGTCVPPGAGNESIVLPKVDGPIPGVDVPHFVTGMTVAKDPSEQLLEDIKRTRDNIEFVTQSQV